ncbi:MAG: D-alanyl-D-alanine carboxypeptidase/D-alanyl-D-alanine-endopeptidase [Ignavibacteriaceae bacterium]|nr:D-alanyl-D-alanine carboxypeptidase/D-alanyl-D-alanine-endopeptidase [Ignavibacteriaceae bacterium]
MKMLQVIFSKLNPLVDNRINKLILIYIILLFQFNLFPQSENLPDGSQVHNPKSAISNLVSGIEKIINDPFFEKTTIAIDIFDLTDSISLFQKNEKLLLRPASNMKLLTTAAALINLGEYYSFRTDLYHTGVIESDTLFGDVFVVGGFDPDFTTEDLDSLVRVIKSLGIKYITGGVYGDISKKDSMYWGRGWMWDDDPEPSAPYLSALNINDNSVEVFVEGSEVGSPAKVTLIPSTEFVKVENNSVTVAEGNAGDFLITRDWVNRKNTILVNGKVSKTELNISSENKSKVNLLYPERYFLTLFKEHLELGGIYIDKPIDIKQLDKNSVYLATIYRAIDTVLSVVNKDSDNLSAEMLLYAMAYNDSGAPAAANDGLAAVKRFIDSIGLISDDYSFADGSGVSHYNLVSAELILKTLKYFYYERKDLFPLFYNSLAVAGVDGTLKNRMKNTAAQNNVHAKTGTLNGVSNLSGYVTAKNGHLLAFSIMIQNFVEEYSKARSFQNRICESAVSGVGNGITNEKLFFL